MLLHAIFIKIIVDDENGSYFRFLPLRVLFFTHVVVVGYFVQTNQSQSFRSNLVFVRNLRICVDEQVRQLHGIFFFPTTTILIVCFVLPKSPSSILLYY